MTMPSPRVIIAALMVFSAACGEKAATPAVTNAPAPAGPPETYESVRGKFVVTLPAPFRGNYHVKESADSILGAKFAAEIIYPADSTGRIRPSTLLVVRVFSKAAWEKLSARKGFAGAVKRAEAGDDVFTLSMITSNPYKFDSAPARMVDRMMLAATTGGLHVDITPR